MNALAVLGVACVVFVAVTCYRVLGILKDISGTLVSKLAVTERQRDSHLDALASVVTEAERGDLDGVLAHARQALETGDYHGRLRAAQTALEEAAAREEAALLACSCTDEMGWV